MKTKWVCIQLACSWRTRAFVEAHHWNIQAKFYNEKFPLVYECDNIGDSLYEKHGATLKHKYGKNDKYHCPFSLFLSFFRGLFLASFLIPHWDNALIMMIIILLFTYNSKNYNSKLEQKYDYMNASGSVPGCAMILA